MDAWMMLEDRARGALLDGHPNKPVFLGDGFGCHPLVAAARNGDETLLLELIAAGACGRLADSAEPSPPMTVIHGRNLPAKALALLRAGCDPSVPDAKGFDAADSMADMARAWTPGTPQWTEKIAALDLILSDPRCAAKRRALLLEFGPARLPAAFAEDERAQIDAALD